MTTSPNSSDGSRSLMDDESFFKKIDLANRNEINYFEVLGTDETDNSENTFPQQYFDYRNEWAKRMKHNDPGTFPLHVDIESTNRCNLRCTMCQIDFDAMKQGNMDLSLFKKVIRECGLNKLPSIKLNYRGEPMVNTHLPEMIKLAKDEGIVEVQFNTNGVLVDEKHAPGLIDAGLDRIKFSIDSATPELYEKIRGTDYERVISNVKNFIRIRNEKRKKRPIVHVQMVYMQDNRNEVIKYYRFWKTIVNRIGFGRYRSTERSAEDDRRVKPVKQVRVPCSQLWQRLLVTYDGQILMCCGDHKALNPLGNLDTISLKEAWDSEQLQIIRRMHMNNQSETIPACAICEVNCTDEKSAQRIWDEVKKKVHHP